MTGSEQKKYDYCLNFYRIIHTAANLIFYTSAKKTIIRSKDENILNQDHNIQRWEQDVNGPKQTCRGTGFGIGPNPCSAWPDTKTRPYFDISDTSQSMYRPRPIHGPIPKHGRTFGSPIPPNPCTEHPIPKPETHTVDYILVQIIFTVVYI